MTTTVADVFLQNINLYGEDNAVSCNAVTLPLQYKYKRDTRELH